MLVSIFNKDLIRIGTISDYLSLAWSEEYAGVGSFMLVCRDNPESIKLLEVGNYIWQNGKKTAMLIRYVKQSSVEKLITVHGYTASDILRQRTAWQTLKIYNAEKGMRDAVTQFANNIPNLIVGESKGYLEYFDTQFTGDELTEIMLEICKQTELGYITEFDYRNARFIFRVLKGKDLTSGNETMLFSEDFRNLNGMGITTDIDEYKNFAHVAGQGKAGERIIVTVGDENAINRFDLYVDARDLQQEDNELLSTYKDRLKARGQKELNEKPYVEAFSAQVEFAGFGTSFYLGDKVICRSKKYGKTLKTRITKYTEVTEDNARKLVLVFGTPEMIRK